MPAWTSQYPTGLDTTTQMPDLPNVNKDVEISHVIALRDAVFDLEGKIGSDVEEGGSLRQRVTALEGGGGVPATATAADLQIYINGTSGSDGNNGLSSGSAKATWSGIAAILPDVLKHNVTINAAGTISEIGLNYLARYGHKGKKLLVDGGSGLTDVVSSLTATIYGATGIGRSDAGWTVDAYKGYIVEITSGALTGQRRLIHSNTATTLIPSRDFSADPGAATFHVARPTTTIQSSSAAGVLQCSLFGQGEIQFQRLYLAGSDMQLGFTDSANVRLAQVVSAVSNAAKPAIYARGCHDVLLSGQTLNTTTWAVVPTTGDDCGPSIRGAYFLHLRDCKYVRLSGGFYSGALLDGCSIRWISEGARFNGAEFYACASANPAVLSPSGYQKVTFDKAAGDFTKCGLVLDGGSDVSLGINVDVSNNLHGIVVKGRSKLRLTGNLSGSGNAGYGAVVHEASQIILDTVTIPTLTGTYGDVVIAGLSPGANPTVAV